MSFKSFLKTVGLIYACKKVKNHRRNKKAVKASRRTKKTRVIVV